MTENTDKNSPSDSVKIIFIRDDEGKDKSFRMHAAGVRLEFDIPDGYNFNDLKMRECYDDGRDCGFYISAQHEDIVIQRPETLKERMKKFIYLRSDQEARGMTLPERARHNMEIGMKFPYGSEGEGEASSRDWPHAAAQGAIRDLLDRLKIKYALEGIDEDTKRDIVLSIAETIRQAKRHFNVDRS